jgi:hypothetical protein
VHGLVINFTGNRTTLLSIPYQSKGMAWAPYEEGEVPRVRKLSTATVKQAFEALDTDITEDGNFMPVQMEIREPADVRGALPTRICLLGSDHKTYRMFALPA